MAKIEQGDFVAVTQIIEEDLETEEEILSESVDNDSDTASITSSIVSYRYENGRRYHAFHDGEYMLPNDRDEQSRLDLNHHLYRYLLGGQLYIAPVSPTPRYVLDIGTGTGIWAIDFADAHPSANVLGNDLSPIQPSWIPPNCRFEVDNFESDWAFDRKFDFIHGRELEGCVRNYQELFSRCHRNLEPGGYLEMQSMEMTLHSDDATHRRAPNALKFGKLLKEASRMFGKSLDTVGMWKAVMEEVGFRDVTEKVYKVPINPWTKDPRLKRLGCFQQINWPQSADSYAPALFTRFLHWKIEEVHALVDAVKAEVKSRKVHGYSKVYMVYGRK